MTHSPSPLADEFASLRRAAQRDAAAARTHVAQVLDVLLLTLLATLLGRLERIARTWHAGSIAPLPTEHPDSVHSYDSLPLSLPALCVALGLVPGWIFRCFPARGMRPIPGHHHARRPSRHGPPTPARAPPHPHPPAFRAPHQGQPTHALFVTLT